VAGVKRQASGGRQQCGSEWGGEWWRQKRGQAAGISSGGKWVGGGNVVVNAGRVSSKEDK